MGAKGWEDGGEGSEEMALCMAFEKGLDEVGLELELLELVEVVEVLLGVFGDEVSESDSEEEE